MKIEFLYYEDCPSHDAALERLKSVLAQEGISASISVIKVISEAQALELEFIGSPTIRVEGRDIDPPPAGSKYGLACRAFRLEDGRVSPLPSEELIRAALQTAVRT